MRLIKLPVFVLMTILSFSCVSFNKIARHDFDAGFYNLKSSVGESSLVYTNVIEDSIFVYQVMKEGEILSPDKSSVVKADIGNIKNGDFFSRSTFSNKSIDVDLTTLILKYRPLQQNVPNQLSANFNAAIYFGFRKDFYKIIPNVSPLHEESSYIRQVGFDAGFFAGIGVTPINPFVTENNINIEYDGFIVQKGIAAFITFDSMSVGVALSFDNLLDKNKTYWVFNQKPYFGLVIGIPNF